MVLKQPFEILWQNRVLTCIIAEVRLVAEIMSFTVWFESHKMLGSAGSARSKTARSLTSNAAAVLNSERSRDAVSDT